MNALTVDAERVESMQVGTNILVIGIVSHKKETVLTTDTSIRDQYRVIALKKAFKSVFTMSHECDDEIYDRVHHLKHAMSPKGASALIKHLDGQNSTVKFDFICLEYVRMPGPYYTNFVTGIGRKPGTPLVGFICRLCEGDKLNSGCKLLLASVGNGDDRWPQTKQLLEKEFGELREVEAKENPYYRACAMAARYSELYHYNKELKNRNSNEKPFAEFTVVPVIKDNALSSPFNLTNPLSEDNDEESDFDPVLNTLLRDMVTKFGEEDSDFDVDAVHRDLCWKDGDEDSDFDVDAMHCELYYKDIDEDSDFELDIVHRDPRSKDGDEEGDFDSQTSTEDTPVAPSTENDRNANVDIDIIDLVSEDDSVGVAFGSSVVYHDGDNNDSCNERDPTLITTPKMTGAASAPQSTELIQKVAQRIANGEHYRTACEALGFNLNENKEYKGSNTSDYSRLQSQVRKLNDEQKRKLLAKWNERLVEELKKVTSQLQYVTGQYRVLQEKLSKCECGSSRKRKITHLQPKKKQRNIIHSINY